MSIANKGEAFAPLEVVSNDDRFCRQSAASTDFVPATITSDTSPPPSEHHKLGKYAARWPYHDADGRLEGFICRFESEIGKKTFRPLRYGMKNGREGWHWVGWEKGGRPLYRLHFLVERPETPVLLVEGEKAADAAAGLIPDHVVATTMNGSQSPEKTDLQPLADRHIVIWPDHDQPGRDYACTLAKLLRTVGVASCRIVDLPGQLPEKWDLADPMPADCHFELGDLLANARAFRPPHEIQGPWHCVREPGVRPPGVYFEEEAHNGGDKELHWVCSPLDVLADTRNASNEDWGRLLAITDRDGVAKEWPMPMNLLAGDSADLRKNLLDKGLVMAPGRKARERLEHYVQTWEPGEKTRCVDRIGWHDGLFILPDEVIGKTKDERVLLQSPGTQPVYEAKGTMKGWQEEVAGFALGNSRLELSILIALGGPLLHPLQEESGGFHLVGPSSIGKTTALRLAASVWGCPVHTWRTTDNAAETLAGNSNDSLLCLDEISQVDGNAADALAYMLGNGVGKNRSRRDSSLRRAKTWRLLLLSTGEIGLAAKMAEVRKRARAGQEVRLVEVPADAGRGHGIFDDLQGLSSGDQLSRRLKEATERHRGHASRAFLKALADEIADRGLAVAGDDLADLCRAWMNEHCPPAADGQVSRVAGRFSLLAAAGEFAISSGVLPWPEGTANQTVARCFRDWLTTRGDHGPAEIREGIKQVRLFIQQHGGSRFEKVPVYSEVDYRPVINRAGFRSAEGDEEWSHLVLPEVWREQVCQGFDPNQIARAMADKGWLKPGSDRPPLQVRLKVPGLPEKIRGYAITPRFLEEVDEK